MSDIAIGFISTCTVLVVLVLTVAWRPDSADALVKVFTAIGKAVAVISPFGPRQSSCNEVNAGHGTSTRRPSPDTSER